jgi:hypothetical protein
MRISIPTGDTSGHMMRVTSISNRAARLTGPNPASLTELLPVNSQMLKILYLSALLSLHRTIANLTYAFYQKGWAPENLINVFRPELLPSIGWDPQLRRCRTLLMDNDGRNHNRQFKAFLGEHGLIKLGVNGFLPANPP